jgi:predicted transcriptional regulator
LAASGIALSTAALINVLDAASEVYSVTIEAETGLVH